MNHRTTNHFTSIAAIGGGAPQAGGRGESNLIVDDDVNGPAHCKPRDVGEG